MIPFDGWTPEQVERQSIQELAAGRLPIRAQQRLATMWADHAFTSDLTVAEHHAIRAVGFAPVGQVLGSCVYHHRHPRWWDCGYERVQSVRAYWPGTFNPAIQVREVAGLQWSLYEPRQRALDRMRQECVGLGGDGVVAVHLTSAPFAEGGLEFRAIGTAVRATGDVRPPWPFMSDLSGQDFAKLISAGWVPCGLVMGLAAMIRHNEFSKEWRAASWRNVEMSGYTELVQTARASAADRMRADCARYGGAGVVLRTMTSRVDERRCRLMGETHDHIAEAIVIGTAITQFRHTGGDAPLPIMRLR